MMKILGNGTLRSLCDYRMPPVINQAAIRGNDGHFVTLI